jgi:hypothetical protein
MAKVRFKENIKVSIPDSAIEYAKMILKENELQNLIREEG